MGFSYSTSFVFEYLSNMTTQLQEKSANHAQPKEKKNTGIALHIIRLLLAVVLFGSNIYSELIHVAVFCRVAKLPVATGHRFMSVKDYQNSF
jgi:hypothetical protein